MKTHLGKGVFASRDINAKTNISVETVQYSLLICGGRTTRKVDAQILPTFTALLPALIYPKPSISQRNKLRIRLEGDCSLMCCVHHCCPWEYRQKSISFCGSQKQQKAGKGSSVYLTLFKNWGNLKKAQPLPSNSLSSNKKIRKTHLKQE